MVASSSPLFSLIPKLVPPLIVVVAPLVFLPPLLVPRDELDALREAFPDLVPGRPRRDELLRVELAEDGREGLEGGARVSTGPSDMGVRSGELKSGVLHR